MTSQNFPRKKGTSHQIRLFTPGKWVQLEKMIVYVDNQSSRPKMDLPCQFQQFSSRENLFHFENFLARLDEKRAAATSLIDQFC